MLITGVHKISVLGVIKYHQLRQALWEEISLHPETMKGLEILHYHVDNNLPVEKELVFKLVPELYVHEINKLGAEDRLRFKKPRISYSRVDGEQLEVDDATEELKLNEIETMWDKTMQMELYYIEQASDVYQMYADKLNEEISTGGHVGLTEYLMQLEVMDDENKKDWEKRLWAEMEELRMIESDIKALQIHIKEKENEIVIPDFIQDPLLREEAYQRLSYIQKYLTVDIRDTALIPTKAYKGPDFDERLREAFDIDAHIEESA